MNKFRFLSFLIFFLISLPMAAQTFYVDAENGNDEHTGELEAPFGSLDKAIDHVNKLTGQGDLIIKLLPGHYLLHGKVVINPIRISTDSTRIIIEAAIMPDDENWTPEKMPIVQSVSPNNSITQFAHSTGFLVASEHVTIQGLKFLGNPNPKVSYYYPISKENPKLADMIVSQCMFVGDKESSFIQGGIWAHGPKNKVSHCVFYECRNAILFFNNVDGFTIENSIVYGSYESAFWFGPESPEFKFENNIIANNANVIVGPENLNYTSPISNSIFVDNLGFIGKWSRPDQKVLPLKNPTIVEHNVTHSGDFKIEMNNSVHFSKNHLHVAKGSLGSELNAGLFND